MKEIIHDPISQPGSRRIGVLVLHGFTGSTWSMRPVTEFFADRGYAVEMPLLPGHGTHWKDMVPISRHDWLAAVDDAYWRLRTAGHEVVVIGLSMGGMLALRESVRRPVLGTAVINPFVVDPTPALRFSRLLSKVAFTTTGITSDIAMPDVDEGGYHRVPLAAAAQLYLLGKETRPMLPALQTPVLYFRSATDHVVSDASHLYFQKIASCPVEFVPLPHSYHVATLDYDAPLICQRTLDFVQSLESRLEGSA
ncbi:alpha/beta fold hydrolase [Rothia sp. LK2588]|uniref:alpha/beta hydrolase n=1 Tax=Rothia sp. LK2588 TaxID=3114369 RepID=UPI0034CEA680